MTGESKSTGERPRRRALKTFETLHRKLSHARFRSTFRTLRKQLMREPDGSLAASGRAARRNLGERAGDAWKTCEALVLSHMPPSRPNV